MRSTDSGLDRPVARVEMRHARRRWPLATAAFVAALGCTHVFAQLPEPTQLVNAQHCMFCHTMDAAFLAPSFRQIAERYRKTPEASAMLEHKLLIGGRAHWGDIPMPPPEQRGGPLSRDDAHTLVQWVLSQ